jgi:hypothetical protein
MKRQRQPPRPFTSRRRDHVGTEPLIDAVRGIPAAPRGVEGDLGAVACGRVPVETLYATGPVASDDQLDRPGSSIIRVRSATRSARRAGPSSTRPAEHREALLGHDLVGDAEVPGALDRLTKIAVFPADHLKARDVDHHVPPDGHRPQRHLRRFMLVAQALVASSANVFLPGNTTPHGRYSLGEPSAAAMPRRGYCRLLGKYLTTPSWTTVATS